MNGLTGTAWAVIAYAAGLALLFGYAAGVWWEGRKVGGGGCERCGKE